MTRLEIRNLSKSFGSLRLFHDVGFAVAAGETLALAGPSGGGKTILLRLIAGIMEPDEGSILIDGKDVGGVGPEARDVGVAFQNFALYPHMTAFENIASPLRARGTETARVKERVTEVAALLKIDHVLENQPRELSNGQKQRTALARALIRRPKVLLLDDPLRNVDAKLRYEMRLELPRLLAVADCAAIYVTQDYREAMGLGDLVGILRAGRFEQIAPPAEIYTRPRSVEIARLFGDPTINLLPCRPERTAEGLQVEIFGRPMPLPLHFAAAEGRDCLIGVRPEHVSVGLQNGPGSLPFELNAVTPLNVRAVLFLRDAAGTELLATCPEDDALAFGRGHHRVFVTIDTSRALLFDRENGQTLALPAAAQPLAA
ncbi:carbohydrate ABC transporter ATP-binding protein, CUT1 family [Arboricoccus pini]|uniref:Carbohydrate ABC transporter ATP-binding protein, CUT1 family n=1 Tax=Arboricoccus pini TaxID=1963835 RepID=A0A212RQG1_9PROT|nr:ABC transporter ATP-binding protein [Arboricoccus pini]SNB74836.1 carbohydrate ABC transporter ATP-binding protein, CUT1 family [Arboricoccus pini]